MFKSLSELSNKPSREEGQGLVEYALILVLVSVVVIVILSLVGPAVGNIFSEVVTVLNGSAEGNVQESLPSQGCHAYHFSQYMEVPGNGYIPAGTSVWTRGECSDPSSGSAFVENSSNPRGYGTNQTEGNAACAAGGYSTATKHTYNIYNCS